MDFVHDQLATGGKFRILTVIDTYSRYARVVDPRPAYRGSMWLRCSSVFAGSQATRA